MEKMRSWHHSGFSVHAEVVIQKEDLQALVRLAQYLVHPSFSAEKIRYIEKTGGVMYKSKLHAGKKRNFEVLDAIEFLHRICLHIPEHYESLIRYYGHYANAARGKRKKLGLEIKLPLKIIVLRSFSSHISKTEPSLPQKFLFF